MLLALSSAQKLGLGLAAATFVAFALGSAMLVPRYRPDFPARRLGWFVAACVLLTVGMLSAVAFLAKEDEQEHAAVETTTATETTGTEPAGTTPTETGATGSDALGKVVFTANCGSCHSLADAGTSGTVGPDLDQSRPNKELVVDRVTNGKGVMPPFKGTLSQQEIADVALYVSAVAGS